MTRCKCCKQAGPRGDYALRMWGAPVELRNVIPYRCPIDDFVYVAEEMLLCAETCATAGGKP